MPQDAGGGYCWGKLTQAQYHGFTCAARQQFNEYFAYSMAGLPVSKRLRVRGAPDDLSIYTDYVASYGYNTDGQITSITYPSYKLSPNPEVIAGEVVTYGVDNMGRLNTVSGPATAQVTGTTYGPADELKTLTFGPSSPWTETRAYNDRLQLTGITAPGRINEQYVYPTANNNNGQISQLIRPGVETITYQYDSLKRLTSAVANTWSQTYGYDGFGNLYQIGTTSYGVNADTNRLVGPGYDPNGNITSINGLSLTYDVENRVTQVTGPGLNVQYVYDPNNRRILGDNGFVFYGVRGEKLMEVGAIIKTFVYFGSRLVRVSGAMGANPANITPDRLGSQGGPYHPYGKEYTPTAENADKFATYHRDLSGLDYAVNRYYSSTLGRFLSPDPYVASGGLDEPQSWNRYAYVLNDPVNLYDSTGLQAEGPPINPYQGILDLIAGRLRNEWIASLNRELPEQLSDFERIRRERTTEFRMWSAEALQKLGSLCVGAFRGDSPCAEGHHNYESLLEEMIHGVTSLNFLDLHEESHRTAILGEVFGGGYTGGDWGKNILEWTGDQGQARAYEFGDSTIILGLSFTVSHTEAGKRDVYTTMIHEMLHVFTTLDDRRLAVHFGLAFQDAPGAAGVTNASRAISDWIRNDCKK